MKTLDKYIDGYFKIHFNFSLQFACAYFLKKCKLTPENRAEFLTLAVQVAAFSNHQQRNVFYHLSILH